MKNREFLVYSVVQPYSVGVYSAPTLLVHLSITAKHVLRKCSEGGAKC